MSFASKLEKLEQEKQQLVQKRLSAIANLAQKAEIIGLEDDVILGALLYAKQLQETKNTAKIEELRGLVVNKFPRRKTKK
jgi:hypothetical protein